MSRTRLPIDQIIVDDSLLPRGEVPGLVKHYAEVKREFEMPPIDVWQVGAKYYLSDGRQRLAADKVIGTEKVVVDLRKGSLSDVCWAAAGANAQHGTPLTRSQKTRAILRILHDKQRAKEPNEIIAHHVGASVQWVVTQRNAMKRKGKGQNKRKVKTRSGRVVEVDVSGRGRPRKGSKDSQGTVVPEFLAAVFTDAELLSDAQTMVGEAVKLVERATKRESGAGRFVDLEFLVSAADDLRQMIQAAKPFAVCETCNVRGKVTKRCPECKGAGWHNREKYEAKNLVGAE